MRGRLRVGFGGGSMAATASLTLRLSQLRSGMMLGSRGKPAFFRAQSCPYQPDVTRKMEHQGIRRPSSEGNEQAVCVHTFVALTESQVALPMAVALVDAKVLNR